MKSCFMFGHADCPDSILPEIRRAIETHYTKYGIRYFYVGSRGRFDALAAAAVRHMKRQYPDIQLFLLLAYHPGERAAAVSRGFDGSYYPPLEHVPKPYAIVRANRYMAAHCDSIICYASHPGNARNLLEYAQRQETGVILENLA